MNVPVSDIAFTPAVKTAQERMGSRSGYAKMEERGGWSNTVTPDLVSFLAERDSFYLERFNSEFNRIRFQYTRDRSNLQADDQYLLQYVMSIGSQSAHQF